MAELAASGRVNQKSRTRKDLLQAAARLMKQGGRPSLDEIAEEALVSRATAYRYFPGLDALLVEASLDVVTPDPEVLFRDDRDDDPIARLERVDVALDDMLHGNEAALRMMLLQSLERSLRADADVPRRQNRRTPLIEAALAPARRQFKAPSFDTLAKSLALVLGTEAMIVFKDVLRVDDATARKVKRFMIRALVDAARKS